LGRGKSKIPTELRAISLTDMLRLAEFIQEKCAQYGWVDNMTKKVVSDAKDVNLYHLVYNFIGPVTAPIGHEVVDSDLKLGSDGEVPGGVAHEKEHNGRRRFRFVRGVPPGAKKGKKDQFVRTFSGSFAELLWNGERKAQYFISHWWGEPVLDFVLCVKEHARVYKLGGDGLYWVCAHANSQTHITEELGDGGPLRSPFFRALERADGALLMIDMDSQVTTRMWCGFENVVIATQGKSLAVATAACDKGHVVTPQPAPVDRGQKDPFGGDGKAQQAQTERQAGFPVERLDRMLHTRLETAEASNPEDRAMIETSVNEHFGGFGNANCKLRVLGSTASFAVGVVNDATIKALNEAQEPYELIGLGSTLGDGVRQGLVLNECCGLNLDCYELGDIGVAALGKGIETATSLATLHLEFTNRRTLGDTGVAALGEGIGAAQSLASLHLEFPYCRELGDTGVAALGKGIGASQSLASLDLKFICCSELGDTGMAALGEGIGASQSLASLHLVFIYCPKLAKLGMEGLGKGLSASQSLAHIKLVVQRCKEVGHAAVAALSRELGSSRSSVIVDVKIDTDAVKVKKRLETPLDFAQLAETHQMAVTDGVSDHHEPNREAVSGARRAWFCRCLPGRTLAPGD